MKKAVLKDFAIFTGKHLCWNLFLIMFHKNITSNEKRSNSYTVYIKLLPTNNKYFFRTTARLYSYY